MNIAHYIRETKNELRHVSWPSRTQAIWYTVLVIVISIAIALYLGLFDLIFTEMLAKFVL